MAFTRWLNSYFQFGLQPCLLALICAETKRQKLKKQFLSVSNFDSLNAKPYILFDQTLLKMISINYLWVLLDLCLSLSRRVNFICATCCYDQHWASSISNLVSIDFIELQLKTVNLNRTDNCNSLFYGIPQNLKAKIRFRHRVGGCISMLDKNKEAQSVLRKLHWLLIDRRNPYRNCTFMFSNVHNLRIAVC